jgi:hypothetical protein
VEGASRAEHGDLARRSPGTEHLHRLADVCEATADQPPFIDLILAARHFQQGNDCALNETPLRMALQLLGKSFEGAFAAGS